MKNKLFNIFEYLGKKNLIMCLAVSFVITILQMLGRFLDVRYKGLNVSTMRIGLEGLLFFVICNLVIIFMWKGGQKMLNTAPLSKPVFSKCWFYQLIILISWLPCYLAYFPGIYSYDGEPQLIQYTSGQLDNHHPIIHTYIIGGCYDLGKWLQSKGISIDGLAFYTTIQCVLLSFAFSYMLRFLAKQKAGAVYIILSMAYICLFPTVPLMAMSSTKDTFFAAFFILFLTSLVQLQVSGDGQLCQLQASDGSQLSQLQVSGGGQLSQLQVSDGGQLKGTLIKLFIFALGCMFFRRNGYYVMLILLLACIVVSFVRIIRNKEFSVKALGQSVKTTPLYSLTLIMLVSVIVFSTSEKIIIRCSNALEGESAEALSIPLQQMARAYKSSDAEVRNKYGDRLSEYISETGLSNYRQLITDGVKQYFNNEYFATNKSDFIKLYVDMGIDYPGSYVLAVLYLTKGDWHILDTGFCEVFKDWWRDRTGYLITDATPVFALDYVTKENLLPGIRDMYEGFATDCNFMKFLPAQVISAPAFYVFLTILGSLALLIKKKRAYYPVMGAMILYLLTMLAGPCVLVRYAFPLMCAIPIFTWCVIINATTTQRN